MNTAQSLRKQFEKEETLHWANVEGEPELEYAEWLEKRIIAEAGKHLPPSDELWDEYSEYIGETIDDVKRVAGATIMTKFQFMSLFQKLNNSK